MTQTVSKFTAFAAAAAAALAIAGTAPAAASTTSFNASNDTAVAQIFDANFRNDRGNRQVSNRGREHGVHGSQHGRHRLHSNRRHLGGIHGHRGFSSRSYTHPGTRYSSGHRGHSTALHLLYLFGN